MLTHKWRASKLGQVTTSPPDEPPLLPAATKPVPSRTHRVAASSSTDSTAHIIVVREFGNPAGKPVIVLHGGPGSYCDPGDDLEPFDLNKFRVFLYDQRGGRGNDDDDGSGVGNDGTSPPSPQYTWQDLVADIDAVRRAVVVERITLFGGSWGSTLALLYARTFPQFTERAVVFGVFLGTRWEQACFYGDQAVADCGAQGLRYLCRTAQTGLIGPSTASSTDKAPRNPRRWWSGATNGGFDGASAVLDAYAAAIVDDVADADAALSRGSTERRLLSRVWHVFESYRSVGAGTDRLRFADLEERMDDAVDHLVQRTGDFFVTGENARVAHAQCMLFPSLMRDVEAAPGGGACFYSTTVKSDARMPPIAVVHGAEDTCCDPAVAAFVARAIVSNGSSNARSLSSSSSSSGRRQRQRGDRCTFRLVDGAGHSPGGNAHFISALSAALEG